MAKYLVSAAFAAVIGAAAFAAPAAAQVDFGVRVGPDRPYNDDRYYGDRYYGPRPGVRVYSGRNAYRGDDCYTRRRAVWVDGRRVVRTVRVCD